MRTSSAPWRIRVVVLGVLAVSGIAAMNHPVSANEALTRKTAAGREVLVRGFVDVAADCRSGRAQTVKVIDAPAHGRIEQRPGPVIVGDTGAADRACLGTQLDGVQVFYIPEAHFVGIDRFVIGVDDRRRRSLHAKVDVVVGADPRLASD